MKVGPRRLLKEVRLELGLERAGSKKIEGNRESILGSERATRGEIERNLVQMAGRNGISQRPERRKHAHSNRVESRVE